MDQNLILAVYQVLAGRVRPTGAQPGQFGTLICKMIRRSEGFSCGNERRKVKKKCKVKTLALDLRQVAMLVVVALGGVFHELKELAQPVALRDFHFTELNAESEGIASGYDAIDNQSLDPDFSICHPQPNLQLGAVAQHGCRFYEAPSPAGVGEVPPDGGSGTFQAQFDRDKTFHAGIASAIFSPGRGKDVRLEGWASGGVGGHHVRDRIGMGGR